MPSCAIWARISTQKESQERSLDRQLDVLRKAAAARGYEVATEYAHRNLSAWDTKRGLDKAITDLIADAQAIGFTALLVVRLDRFSRAGVAYTMNAIKTLKDAGIDFIEIEGGIDALDATTADGELKLSIAAYIARKESEHHSARVKAGMERRREQGGHLGRPRKKRRSRVIK